MPRTSFVDLIQIKDKTAEGLDKNLREFILEHCKILNLGLI